MTKLLFPGSFDPFTIGHKNVVERALRMADEVVIAIGVHPEKKGMFSVDERKQQIERLYEDEPRVSVITYEGLTTDLAMHIGAAAMLRSVRSVKDFEYEREMADINRLLTATPDRPDGLDTILLLARPDMAGVSSSVVRELIRYGKDPTPLVPQKQ